MNDIRYLMLLILLAACAGLDAQEIPAGSEETEPRSEEIEAPVSEGEIAEEAVAEEVEAEGSDGSEAEEPKAHDAVEGVGKASNERVVFGNDSHLGPEERSKDMVTIGGNAFAEGRVQGDMVTIGGNSIAEGRVDMDMVTIWGDATLSDSTGGDFVVIMGSGELGPGAEVGKSAVVIGGKLTVHPTAKIHHERLNFPFFFPGIPEGIQTIRKFVQECVLLARPISLNVPFTLYMAGILLLFYLLLAVIFPKPLQGSGQTLADKPLQSFLIGILVYASGPIFFLLMAITVIGLALVPFVYLAVLALTIFGKAVVFFHIGKQIARATKLLALENVLLSVILGGIVVYALYMIPFFGFFLWLVLSILGLGAVCLLIGNSISKWKAAGQADPPDYEGASLQAPGQSNASASDSQKPVQPGTSLEQVESATAALFRRVGFWWRTLATSIDLILVGALVSLLDIAIFAIPLFAYFIIFWGWKGSTLGGMALGIRVQKISGEPIDWPTSVIRSLSSIVSLLPFFLGFFWAGWDPEKQSWHDKIAGTAVVRIPQGYTWS